MNKKEKGIITAFSVILVALIAAIGFISFISINEKAKEPSLIDSQTALINGADNAAAYSEAPTKAQGETEKILESSASGAADEISLEEAKSIALEASGQNNNASIVITKQKLEKDDGKRYYEIEFTDYKTEYEYEIDLSGNIISQSTEAYDAD